MHIVMDMAIEGMEGMADTMEDMAMVDMDMVDATLASGLPMQSPLQLLKLMLILMHIVMDMAIEGMADTMEDMAMVDTATEAMVATTVVSGLPMQSPLQLLKLMLMPMLIATDMVGTMEDMVDTMEDIMVDMATEAMVDTTVASGLPKQNPLQLLKLMPSMDMVDMDMEDTADTMEDMVDTGATEDMVDTTVASVRLMLMPITMVASVATEVMVVTMVDTVDMDMVDVDMATEDKQIYIVSS